MAMKFLYKFLFYRFERKRIQFFQKESQVTENRSRIGGIEIFYLEKEGSEEYPPMVLIHGLLDGCYGFRKLVQHLNYPGRILIPDLPGYGRSKLPKISYLYQLDIFADILYYWLESMGLKNLVLCGHSMGGLVSQKMVLQDQKKPLPRIDRLILLATGGIPHPEREEMRKVLFPKSIVDVSRLLGYLYHSDFPEPGWLAKKTLVHIWNGFENDSLAENTIRREDEIFFGEKAKEIKIPTLIVVGEEDELTTLSMMIEYKKWIEFSQLVVLEKTRHALHNERPEEVSGHINDFLEQKKP